MCEALNKLKTVLVNSIRKKTKVENSVKHNVTAGTTNETTSFVLTQEEKAKLRQTILENRFPPQPTEVGQCKNNSCTLKPKTEFSFY